MQLQKLCLSLHKDMDQLCTEYSGLYVDSYFHCPHCVLLGSTSPTKRPLSDFVQDASVDWVPCDQQTTGSDPIPAALIFLRLLGKSEKINENLIKYFQGM